MRVFTVLILLFFIELGGFVAFSREFGFFTLVVEIILSGILGMFLFLNTLSRSNESILEFLRGIRDPREIVVSNVAKIFGAFLLIIPGIFGDCLGLLLQFGILDSLLLGLIGRFGFLKFQATHQNTDFRDRSDEIIDVEVIEESTESQKMLDDAIKK